MAECRICGCTEEEDASSPLVLPCRCPAAVHQHCLQQWLDKRPEALCAGLDDDLACEVCRQKIRGDFRARRRTSRSASDGGTPLTAVQMLSRRREAVLLALSAAYFRFSMETESRADRFLLRSLGDLVPGGWNDRGGRSAAKRFKERVGAIRAAKRRLERWRARRKGLVDPYPVEPVPAGPGDGLYDYIAGLFVPGAFQSGGIPSHRIAVGRRAGSESRNESSVGTSAEGAPTGADAATDATVDSGEDSGEDAAADAVTDAATDAAADTGADAAADAGADAGSATSRAATESDVRACGADGANT